MDASKFVRLSVMMFLQFFVWGAWYVTAPSYLGQIGFGPGDFGWTYSVGPIAGIISPFILGLIADRYFNSERVLGVMHLLGAGAMFGATFLMKNGGSPSLINVVFFGHMLCFYPTLSLTNTIALHNMNNAEKEFPLIRVFGTIGWIAANQVLGWLGWSTTIDMFYLTAFAGLLLGILSFGLPTTPPPAKGKAFSAEEALGLKAIGLLFRPSYGIFMLCSVLICIPLAFYYQMAARTVQQSGIENFAATMSWGQISEIFFMLVMPLFFARLGVKWMLAVGMLAWVARYGLFSMAIQEDSSVQWMIITGVLLHGICYDFFFVTGQIYTEKAASDDIRAQAQGLLVMLTLGVGMLIGAQVAGKTEAYFTPPESTQVSKEVETLTKEIDALQEQLKKSPDDADLKKQIKEKTELKDAKYLKSLQLIDWKSIWMYPALGALAVLVLFVLAFHDKSVDTDETVDKKHEDEMAGFDRPQDDFS